MFQKIALILLICFCTIPSALSIGVGVSPGNMTYDSHVGIGSIQTLYVKNDGAETSNYRLYVDDEYVGWFDISPNNFSLEAGDYKAVEMTVKPPITATGNHDLKAYVIATSSASDFEIGSGIKIPVSITVSNTGLFVGFALLILIGIVSTVHAKRKK